MKDAFFGRGLYLKILVIPLVFIALGAAMPGVFGFKLMQRDSEREVEEKARMLARAVEAFHMATKGPHTAAAHGSIRCEGGHELRRAMRRHEVGPRDVAWSFKHAALNPTDKKNKANAYESRLIATFEADHNLQRVEEKLADGRGFHVIARPTVAAYSCLRCHGNPDTAPPKKRLEYGRTAGFNWRGGQVVGATIVYVPTDDIQAQSAGIFWTVTKMVALVAVLCIGMLIWRVRTVVVNPMQRLLETSNAMAAGDFKATYPSIGTADEIDELAGSFQNAVHRLKARLVQEEKTRSLFQQFIPASVGAQALGRDPDAVMKGSRHSVTVMVINIRNSKLMIDKLEPEKTVAALNDFFAAANKVITDHHGMTSKYLGDTVMAYFGMPASGENHCLNAVKAALELPKALQDFLVRLEDSYGWQLGIGVGISTGEPIVGQFGSSEHFEYSVLGDVVRDAHRLEEVTKATPEEDSFVISEEVYREVMSHVQVFDLGEKVLKDGSKIKAFTLQGMRVEMKDAVKA